MQQDFRASMVSGAQKERQGMERSMVHNAVDIVVPVYNGYEDLVRCVESILRNTDLSRHRVILIDDCSKDERVEAFLREVCGGPEEGAENGIGSDKGMIAVFNQVNMGFSANVNRGLAWSDRDTIVLNSDTIVTQGWVEKLQSCAGRSKRIATVTPLSNAATLASVPVFLKDNPLPEGYTADSYARLVERVSLHRYPRIPVGVGFCMYVRNEAYALAGAFDEKAFGRGYGEENDFCFRCTMLGFIHVLCDDTFIYHRGTASFGTEEKKRLIEEHTQILRRRYPEFMEQNDVYCREDPDSEIRDNLLLHQCLDNGKKNLLYFLHLDFRQIGKKNIGGTQLHVRDLVTGAKEHFNVFVCARDKDTLRLTLYLQDQELPEWAVVQQEALSEEECRLVTFQFPIGPEESFPVLYDEQIAGVLRKILTSFHIDLVHVHHTQGLSLDVFRECRNLEIPVIATLHDYYYACPTTKLLTPEGRFCPMEGSFVDWENEAKTEEGSSQEQQHPFRKVPSEAACAACLKKNCGYGRVHVIRRWREENAKALERCEKIIFPSDSARRIMCEAFPLLETKSMTISHGTDPISAKAALAEDLEPVMKTDRVHSRLDQLPGDGGSFHYISGWAYLEGSDSVDTSIIIEVTGPDGRVSRIQVRPQARPDVAAAYEDPRYLWSGIHAVFQVPGMKKGRIRIRLLIREGDKTYTDGKIYRTLWDPEAAGDGKLNVAYLGGVTRAKGSDILLDLIAQENAPFRLFVYGEVGDPRINPAQAPDHVFFSGVYQKDDIFDLLRASRIDVALIAPAWAETFCYTLSEAWSCRIPVIGTDLGAVGERIRKTGAGWLLKADANAEDVRKLIEWLRSHPEELKKKKRKAGALSIRTVADMNEQYRNLYTACLVPAKPVVVKRPRSLDPEFMIEALAMANHCVKGQGASSERNRLWGEYEMLRASMELLKNTTSYRVARKISEANIPFKEPLKKLLKR